MLNPPHWGNLENNRFGIYLEEALIDSQLFVPINTGEVTRIGASSSSAIDLTLCKEQVAWRCSWQTIPDLANIPSPKRYLCYHVIVSFPNFFFFFLIHCLLSDTQNPIYPSLSVKNFEFYPTPEMSVIRFNFAARY